jgi:putative ABC transport system substrate-binding protein
MGAKSPEILREIAPRMVRVGVLREVTVPGGTGVLGAIQAAAQVELKALDVRDAATIERGLSAFAREADGGLIVVANPATSVHRELIIALAARHRLPAIYPYRYSKGAA